ncbi:MAG TPA: hypothetical protein VMU16_09180 [Candidatus Binataceae bacterium]|nr:hypothetical protein [Candidatus Binataceae bacterium]
MKYAPKLITLISAGALALMISAPVARAQNAEAPAPAQSPASAQAPAPGPGGHPAFQQIMKERLAACEKKSEGDACTFTSRDGKSIDGACHKIRNGKVVCLRQKHGAAGDKAGSPKGAQ